jgi:hypothetical protein
MKPTRLARVVGALLLFVASEAGAECAWVMYQETVSMESKGGKIHRTGDWTRQSAHATYNECVLAARRLALKAQSDPLVTFAFGAPGKLLRAGEEGVYEMTFASPPPPKIFGSLTFQCFPDTVDPRK